MATYDFQKLFYTNFHINSFGCREIFVQKKSLVSHGVPEQMHVYG